MKNIQLILLTSLILCNPTTNNQENQKQMDSNQNTITIKFKIDKMLGIGWGTVYVVTDFKLIRGDINIPDTLGIYVAVGNTIKAKVDLHTLKIGEWYTAKFNKGTIKSDKPHIPTGTTGFMLSNRDVWQLQSIQKNMETKLITVEGIALNAKLGAIVKTEKGEVFFLQGIDEWPDNMYEKKVKVTGSISSEYHDPKNLVTDDGLHKTGMSGEKLSLQNAKWEIINE